jgi:ribosomal protein L24E
VTGWRTLDSPWYATEIVHCALCGQMIAGRVWVVEDGGNVHRFCGPECERIHATYWVPRYRRTGSSPPART